MTRLTDEISKNVTLLSVWRECPNRTRTRISSPLPFLLFAPFLQALSRSSYRALFSRPDVRFV